jgi:hypothetical protein
MGDEWRANDSASRATRHTLYPLPSTRNALPSTLYPLRDRSSRSLTRVSDSVHSGNVARHQRRHFRRMRERTHMSSTSNHALVRVRQDVLELVVIL